MTASLKVRLDKFKEFVDGINALTQRDVLVGVPDSGATRQDETPGPMNNATLAYIHDNGSPAANIPARPFMRPGIKAAQEKIEARLKNAATAALDGQKQKIDDQLSAAGMVAATSIKKEINDGDFAPLSPSTVAGRARSRGTKSRRKAELEYLEMVRNDVPPELAQGVAGIHPLVNTGQLRNSITYVLRGKK